jgi:hypothetical protein
MAYVITGTANLNKNHVSRVAYNLCDPDAVDTNNFDINCSLVCYLKQPFISGMASFFTYREDCNNNLIGTRLYTPNMFFTAIGCPTDYNEESINNNTWVGSSSHTTSHGVVDGNPAGYRIKIDVVMTAVTEGRLTAKFTTSRLMPGSLQYVSCNSITMEMTETKESASSDGYDARYYESPLMATSFNQDDCGGEVKYVKSTIALLSYHFGCSISYEPSASKCNLRTKRGGFIREYSCLVALTMPKDKTSWNPKVVQLGVNTEHCSDNDTCGCYYWDGNQLNPARSNSIDLRNVGCPDESPSSNIQRIQHAFLANSGYGSYEVVLKTIGLNSICVAARLVGISNGPWVLGTLIYLKYTSPLIMQADFTGLLAGDPVFQFYGMEFPTALVEDCQVNPIQDSVFFEPLEEKKSLVKLDEKINPVSDSNLMQAREMIRKIYKVKQKPCISLGMALEEVASCGCGGSVLHICKIHKTCRQSGNDDKVQLCWKCPDYVE